VREKGGEGSLAFPTQPPECHPSTVHLQAVVYDGYNFYLKSASEPRIYREGYAVLVTEPTAYELRTNCTP
jgi:hypothetical protein